VYDTLLFFHVLAAFCLAGAIVLFSGYSLGAPAGSGGLTLGARLEDVGGLGTLALGIWLALYVDAYELLDGWIIAAIVIWAAAAAAGNFWRQRVQPVADASGPGPELVTTIKGALVLHWVRTALFVLLLADMVWKPGA
jgi:hypothetical protein